MSIVTAEAPEILLASASPRRRELLTRAGFLPVVRPAHIPEQRAAGESPTAYTERLARQKALAVADALADTSDDTLPVWTLSADTIVALGDTVLEKPADHADARAMLRVLSGQGHEVHTSFAWLHRHRRDLLHVETVTTRVFFRHLDDQTIARYVATGEPMDKAGAYGIQDLAEVFVERVEGSYSAVVGLPLCAVIDALQSLGGLGPYPFIRHAP